MANGLMERTMAPRKRRPDAPKRDDVAVKIDRTLADKARLVASRRGGSMAEYLTDLLRGQVERDFAQVLKDMAAESGFQEEGQD